MKNVSMIFRHKSESNPNPGQTEIFKCKSSFIYFNENISILKMFNKFNLMDNHNSA